MDKDLLTKKIFDAAKEGTFSCGAAFKLADELNCSLKEIGDICNEKKIKIRNCQLGCFK